MTPDDESLRVEYQASQDCYLHYDAFRWQAGSILIAGVFVFWGVLFTSTPPPSQRIFGQAGVLVALLMSLWLLFAQHYRQIYLFKLHRIRELEGLLGMEQHRRFWRDGVGNAQYNVSGLRGHVLDRLMYVVTSCGTSALGAIINGPASYWLLAPVPLALVVLLTVQINERRTQATIKTLSRV